MNTNSDDNGVKYVFSLSSPNKKISLKKVNIKDIPASALRRIIRCKKISSMREATEHIDSVKTEEDNNDDVELTVVSTTQNTIIVGNPEERQLERASKKIKIELSTPLNKTDMPPTNAMISDAQVHASPKLHENDYVEMGEEDYDDDYIDDEEEDYISDESYSAPRMVRPIVRNQSIKSASSTNYDYVSPSNYRAKQTSSDSSEKRRSKAKMFRTEWLNIDIFRDWLDRDPNDPCKARCLACNTVMNAGKSELEKHAAGAKHCRALQQMQLLQQQAMMQELANANVDDSNEEVRHSDGSSGGDGAGATGTQSLIIGDPQTLHSRELQLEALNRIATAVESMSTVMMSVLEKMTSNQDSLVQVLQQLANK